ncbi:MAG: class I SAM-dependent methyltransferase [Arenimonas sp.]
MRSFTLLLSSIVLTIAGCASTGTSSQNVVASAIANPARSDADRERDARDKPQQVLSLAGFKRDMVIADIFGGGGYYSEILSDVVGPNGQIKLINNPQYDNYAKKGLTPRLADNRLPNVKYEVTSPADMKLGNNTLDGALIVMSYHDLYVADADWPAIDAAQFIDQIVTALKPGGVLLIVDHAAREGSGKADAPTLHRIDEKFAIQDFKSHGLEFAGSISDLRSSADDRALNVFNAGIKGKTDRFVHIYKKKK